MRTGEPGTRVVPNETGRIEAFSDGVFAIAITLLILDIKVPQVHEESELLSALAGQWPTYLAFLTSFSTIGIMWINHHRLFNLIGRSTHSLLILNSLLLMGVTFVPFPTSLASEYVLTSEGRVALMVYSGTFVVIAVVFNLLWRYASSDGRLLAPDADPILVAEVTRQYAFGPLFYVAAFGLAMMSAPASMAGNLLIACYFALPRRPRIQMKP